MNAIRFTLQTTLSSWATGGSAIVPSMPHPTWSAIVGMVGAALGLPRGDERLPAIARDYGLALRIDQAGERAYDFHTIQSTDAPKVAKIKPRSRAQELDFAALELNTTITQREYVEGAVYTVFVVQLADSPIFSPEEIIAALADPVYPLSAGRRSCLIGSIHSEPASTEDLTTVTHWDQRIPLPLSPAIIHERRDMLVGNRQFAARFECVR